MGPKQASGSLGAQIRLGVCRRLEVAGHVLEYVRLCNANNGKTILNSICATLHALSASRISVFEKYGQPRNRDNDMVYLYTREPII